MLGLVLIIGTIDSMVTGCCKERGLIRAAMILFRSLLPLNWASSSKK